MFWGACAVTLAFDNADAGGQVLEFNQNWFNQCDQTSCPSALQFVNKSNRNSVVFQNAYSNMMDVFDEDFGMSNMFQ